MKKEKEKTSKHPGGRPSTYSLELAKNICHAVATSTNGLKKICKDNPEFPSRDTIYQWQIDFPEFSDMYTIAKRHQANILAEEILDIADDASEDIIFSPEGFRLNTEFVQRSRIRIDTRKWIACKLLPRIYGDKAQHEINVISHEKALELLDDDGL